MEKILEVTNLKKTFYKNKTPFTAVNEISFTLNRGECLGLVGESGCGKSTAAKMITRLLEPDSGSIRLDGEEILGQKGKKKKELYTKMQMIFQIPQDSFDPRCTLGDGIMESMRNHGMKRKDARKRRALAVDPRILICDEATSALDVTIQAQIMDLLSRLQRDRGLSILLICHDLALVQKLCQRVLVMYKGSIIETGMTDEVIRHPREEYTKILIDSVF